MLLPSAYACIEGYLSMFLTKDVWRDLSITFLSSGCSLARLSRYDDGLALLKSFPSIISPFFYTPILIALAWAVSKELTIFPGSDTTNMF